jgi:hypothetical protein
MVNSNEIIVNTENLTLYARLPVNQYRYNRVGQTQLKLYRLLKRSVFIPSSM